MSYKMASFITQNLILARPYLLKMKIVNWWNSRSIPVAGQVWKPGLFPKTYAPLDTNSWFKASKQTYSDGNPYLYETNQPKEFDITRKIKIHPTKEQRDKLTEWWDAYRFTYNKTIEEIRTTCPSETIGVSAHIDVQNDKIRLEVGTRFEMDAAWKLDLKYVTEPKVKLTRKKLKSGLSKYKIQVLEDPEVRPVKVDFHFEYPEVPSWYDFRNKLVTYKYHKSTKGLPQYQGMTKEKIEEANTKPMFKEHPWLMKVDKRIRAGAAKDARAAYETICTLAKDYGKKGTMGPLPFKRKKHGESWTISMEKTCIQPVMVQKTRIGRKKKKRKKPKAIQAFYVCPGSLDTPILCYERIPDEFGDPKIHKDRYGDWWLLLPVKKNEAIQTTMKPGIALDPGISTAFVGYSDNGSIYNYVEQSDSLVKDLKSISAFQSMIDRKDLSKKRKAQTINRLRKRVQNKVNDMHWKVAASLCQDHNLIVIGKLKVKGILESDTITKCAKRKLQALGHYGLKQKLKYKAASLGVKVAMQNEWGTTVACPCCGRHNRISLSERTYVCSCGYAAHRDDKSACCIMIKHLAGVW